MGDDDQGFKPPPHISRQDLHEALRFVHAMAMQSKSEIDRIDTVLAALVRALLETKRIDRQQVDALLPEATAHLQERARHQVTVDIGPAVDKYAVPSPQDLDCEALLPICQGRCCRLTFALSFQDLEEGSVQWNYGLPYRIRQTEDGYCVHADPASHRCTVYQRRPATCRKYDCRADKRIWQDFERRIPAPMESTDGMQRLYKIRRIDDDAARMDS